MRNRELAMFKNIVSDINIKKIGKNSINKPLKKFCFKIITENNGKDTRFTIIFKVSESIKLLILENRFLICYFSLQRS